LCCSSNRNFQSNKVQIISKVFQLFFLSVLFYRFRTPKDTGTKEDGFELLSHATRLERKGQIEEALKAYLYISEKYSEHEVGKDAKISYDVLQKNKNGG